MDIKPKKGESDVLHLTNNEEKKQEGTSGK